VFAFDDLFTFYRFWLGWIVTIYASVLTVRSLWGWYVWLAGQDRHISLVRRYILVHGLRLRLTSFFGDLVVCLLLCVAFVVMMVAHAEIQRLGEALERVRGIL
jgi:hypothetical protein